MTYPPIIIRGTFQREMLRKLSHILPLDTVVTFKGKTRSLDQNARLWAMLTDVSKAIPEGRRHTPEDWKAIFMNAAGWEIQFCDGLDGRPFPSGFKSSRMSVKQMTDLIEFIFSYGDTHGVTWSEPHPDEERSAQ